MEGLIIVIIGITAGLFFMMIISFYKWVLNIINH